MRGEGAMSENYDSPSTTFSYAHSFLSRPCLPRSRPRYIAYAQLGDLAVQGNESSNL